MLIGERVKIARHAAGMSQRDLAKAVGVSAMAISKYERGLDIPGSGVLINLARALGVKTEYFLRPVSVTLSAPSYRRRQSLPRRRERAIMADIQDWLERYLDVESFFKDAPHFELPTGLDCRVTSLVDVERVALGLREAWQLGQGPIESLVEVLEDRGIKVGLVEGHDDFDALTFWANGEVPVIAVKRGVPGDRQRFNLAHELGHLILKPADDVDAEKAAYRFAGAFLVTETAARFELGSTRQTLDLFELHLLKHKYGLSMQAWIYRARDLGILSGYVASRLFRGFGRKGWHRCEPGDRIPPEEPARMKRLVLRALAEDLISESRAAELLGMPLTRFRQEEAEIHDGFPVGVRA
jgi:transcriptional regulator with XRE-family HTH domain/Zn-dependent peptidase ImmA (M78 family)